MKRSVTVAALLAVLALAGLTPSAQAAPSLEGYTGLLLTPTADALNQGEYNLAFFALNLEEGADEDIFARGVPELICGPRACRMPACEACGACS